MSNGLSNCLKFILQYCKEICGILEKNKKMFKGKDTNFLLKVAEPKIDVDIDNITSILDSTKKRI